MSEFSEFEHILFTSSVDATVNKFPQMEWNGADAMIASWFADSPDTSSFKDPQGCSTAPYEFPDIFDSLPPISLNDLDDLSTALATIDQSDVPRFTAMLESNEMTNSETQSDEPFRQW